MAGTSVAFAASGAAAPGGAGGRPKLEHAYLVLHEPSADGTLSKPGAKITSIPFQFNPKTLQLGKSAEWARQTGNGHDKSSPAQYRGPQPSKLSLEMFFDASDTQDGSVVSNVELLFTCCVPTRQSVQQDKKSPPWVLFRWGSLTGFLAYVSSVTAKYELFTSGGLPIRATCTVTLEELSGDSPKQNPTSGGLIPRRVHTLVEGDTLAGVSYREYGDPALWRSVARANGIDDPMRLRPGVRILLPTVEELAVGGPVGPNAAPIRESTALPALTAASTRPGELVSAR